MDPPIDIVKENFDVRMIIRTVFCENGLRPLPTSSDMVKSYLGLRECFDLICSPGS